MGAFRKLTTGVLASALLATSLTPAMADGPWGGGHGGWGRHHDHDGIGAGAIIAGILGIGIIAAVASSASSNHQEQYPRNSYPNTPPPPPVSGNGYPQPGSGAVASENEAVDACAYAAEEQGGRSASVRDIKQVKANDNGWDVKGVIEQRHSYRQTSGELHNFKCTVRYGQVQSVRIEEDLAYND
jgi:hypothetical protein